MFNRTRDLCLHRVALQLHSPTHKIFYINMRFLSIKFVLCVNNVILDAVEIFELKLVTF